MSWGTMSKRVRNLVVAEETPSLEGGLAGTDKGQPSPTAHLYGSKRSNSLFRVIYNHTAETRTKNDHQPQTRAAQGISPGQGQAWENFI